MLGRSESKDRNPSVAGIILAGTFPWANSAFNQLSARPLIPVAHRRVFPSIVWLSRSDRNILFAERGSGRIEASRVGWSRKKFNYLEDRMPRVLPGAWATGLALCSEHSCCRRRRDSHVDLARLYRLIEPRGPGRWWSTPTLGAATSRRPAVRGLVFDRRGCFDPGSWLLRTSRRT